MSAGDENVPQACAICYHPFDRFTEAMAQAHYDSFHAEGQGQGWDGGGGGGGGGSGYGGGAAASWLPATPHNGSTSGSAAPVTTEQNLKGLLTFVGALKDGTIKHLKGQPGMNKREKVGIVTW
jgi:hypothetical protein